MNYYVTKGYNLKEFETEEDAFNYIKADVSRHELSYKEIYNHNENAMQVIIYQYCTLYLETYIIHNEIDLRDRRI